MDAKKRIVISAINLVSGGTLTILYQCLDYICNNGIVNDYEFFFLVHNRNMFSNYSDVCFIEFPKSKKNWLYRLYYEYFYFNRVSRRLKPYLWLSLHDTTPTVKAEVRAVYMHNAMPFYKGRITTLLRNDVVVALFALFYKYVYRVNIKQNDYLICQQEWLRQAVSEMFTVSKQRIIVAPPTLPSSQIISEVANKSTMEGKTNKFVFFFPSLPRPFKNFETICKAAIMLHNKNVREFEVILTLDGTENKYAKSIVSSYVCPELRFVGLLSREKVYEYYGICDCLIFPSLLETWGLPISEFIPFDKPMIVSDLPYAHETANGAREVAFVNTRSPEALANTMLAILSGDMSAFGQCNNGGKKEPYAQDWEDLFKYLISGYGLK